MGDTQTEEIDDSQPPGNQSIIFPSLGQDNFLTPKQEPSPLEVKLPKFKVRIESDINECQLIWNSFSPKVSIFDLWDFRYPFWLGYKHKPHFICLESDKIEAVLPLWFDKQNQSYSWFGSYWHEDNSFFVKDERLTPLLLKLIPQHTTLNAISSTTIKNIPPSQFSIDDPKYTLNIEHWESINSLLLQLTKKHRYNLKRDYKLISDLSPEIKINDFQDFKQLRQLNMHRFTALGDTDLAWADPRRIKTFEKIIEIGQSNQTFNSRMLTVTINGIIAGVDLIVMYNDCYYPMVCGYNVEAFSGIGNYFTWIEIEDALSLGMKKIDVLEGSYGWKNRFFQPQSLFKICT